MLPILLQEGGQGHCHLESPNQHMETALVLATAVGITSRNHRHTRSQLTHRHVGEGKYLPT